MSYRDDRIKRERRAATASRAALAPWADPNETARFLGERLHPESLHALRQLIKLHGASRLIAAIKEIEAQT